MQIRAACYIESYALLADIRRNEVSMPYGDQGNNPRADKNSLGFQHKACFSTVMCLLSAMFSLAFVSRLAAAVLPSLVRFTPALPHAGDMLSFSHPALPTIHLV